MRETRIGQIDVRKVHLLHVSAVGVESGEGGPSQVRCAG